MPPRNDTQLLLRLPTKLKIQLDETARTTGMGTNEYIRFVLRKDIERRKKTA